LILTAHKTAKIHNIRRKMDKKQLEGMTVVRKKTGELGWGLPPISFTKAELQREKVSASGLKDHVFADYPLWLSRTSKENRSDVSYGSVVSA